MIYEIELLVHHQPVKNVAFYDRASTKPQATNYIRNHYSELAIEIAALENFNLVESGDLRNGGVCFLDVCSGDNLNDRKAFSYLLENDMVDTIIAVSFDRLARGHSTLSALAVGCKLRHKNLGIYLNEEDIESKKELTRILPANTRK